MNIRIVLVDDHDLVREALRERINREPGFSVVAETSHGAAVFDLVERTHPDIVLLDVGLPGMSGIEVAARLGREQPTVRVVALSGYAERMFVEEMLKAGARAYLLKSAGTGELFDALRAVARGALHVGAGLGDFLIRRLQSVSAGGTPPASVLTAREREVLCLLASGRRAADIGNQLRIAATTVEVHRRNLKRKLGVHTTAELTRYAIREGLTTST